MGDERIERDALGEVRIPTRALWGPETQRALENFRVGGPPMPRDFLRALGLIKQAAAETNVELGLLDAGRGQAIARAAAEMAAGALDAEFPVEVFQTGSGTSTNMNANEVLARRAAAIAGSAAAPVDPHDHVNLCQSSNDVIPSALHTAGAYALENDLLPALRSLRDALRERAQAFETIVKTGRTHLQDAAPVLLGQVFGGYARQLENCERRLAAARDELLELALGGTAVGTGLAAHPAFAAATIARLAARTGLPFREASDHFEAQGSVDKVVAASGALRTTAVALYKIANDVRWQGSGPRAGLGELRLPAVQPGSSLMPGKVNPVLCESAMMAACQVMGHDAAIALGGMGGNFELNTFLPLLAHDLLESIRLLAGAARGFEARCVRGLEAQAAHCRAQVERSTALATALVPRVGHARAVEIAQEAARSGRTVREVARDWRVLPTAELDVLLDPARMTRPQDGAGDAPAKP
jgi:fumarate hydratase class II